MSALPKVQFKSDNLKPAPSWLTNDVADGLICFADALAVASAVMPAAFVIPSKSGDEK